MKSRQEVFTAAYRGLRTQKWERSMSVCKSYCTYNGAGGIHCAIGWAFSVPAGCEGYLIFGLPENVIPKDEYVSLGQEFLYKLQKSHDGSATAEEMMGELAALAREYGLEIPPDDGRDPVLVP